MLDIANNDMFVLTLLILVIIIIIRAAPDFQTGVLRVSVVVYGVMLYRHVCKIRDGGKKDQKTCEHTDDVKTNICGMMTDLNKADINNLNDDDNLDLSVNVDTVEEDNSDKENDSADENADNAQLRELIYNDHYNEEGRIYHTAANRYTSCHPPPSYEIEKCQLYDKTTFDEENSRQQRERNRGKRSIDGTVSKTADYYRIHYGREFEKEENKHGWWGNYNYGYTEW
jgi:hypothetical protein